MTRFASALESFIGGRTDLPALEDELKAQLSGEPSLAPVLNELIETSYHSGRITDPAYRSLMQIVRPAQASVSASAPPAADPEETRFRSSTPQAVDDGETRYRPPSKPAPAGEDAATVLAGNESRPRSGNSTSPGWTDPSQWSSGDSRAPRPGDVIKERFVLEGIIGEGGMGIVFRARDLRKEEAQDRHPYAALKVLNEHFKQHPESLKALQREARKAQNLAHPNIVTVYDFDRDGANVFMVMELLEGEPLDRYIKRLNGVGLSMDKALPIIRALCGALSYAHEHGVVHSDFKPANAFVTRTGAIKVFDFGIARAAKRQGEQDETGTKTLFDPGTLGALTPAYASCEMIDGLEPDPRDDVYALGCVAYELLTGKHPFDRKPATVAREAKLKPKPVRGLTGRQWRGLRRSLAFDRSVRSASALKFLEEISPEKRSPAVWIGTAAAVLIVGGAAVLLVPDYLQRRRAEAIATLIRSGAADSIEQALPQIQALSPDVRAAMLLDEGLRASLIGHFTAQIETATDRERQKYDYPGAEALIGQLQQLFPDSQAVEQIRHRLTTRKNDEIKQQSDRFDEFLRQGWLVAGQNAENISAVLAVIALIDPRHPLLADPRLPSAYAEQAQIAIGESKIELAQSLTRAGLAVASADSTLKDLNDVVNRELDAQQRATRLADLRRRLAEELPNAATLAAIEPLHADLAALKALAPDDAQFNRFQLRMQELLDREVDALIARQSYDDAQDLVARYADLTLPGYVEGRRASLENAREKTPGGASRRDATVAQLRQELDALLKAPGSDDRWDTQVAAQLAKLSAYLAPTDSYLVGARREAATSHVRAATELRQQARLSEAERSLQKAIRYAPDLEAIASEQQQLAQMRAEQDSRDREQKRLAELAALKQKLLDQATANEVAEAASSLRELRASLAADDTFLTATAPKAIAGAYVRLAAIEARDGKFGPAITLIDRALEIDRTNSQATAQRERYSQQLAATQSAAPPKADSPATAPTDSSAPSAPKAEPPAAQVASQTTPQATTQTPSPAATQAASQATTGTACTAALAGYGTRSRGICFDALPTGRGPELVVVPAGAGVARPFAIGRYEVSAGDYAAFCQQSGKCRAPDSQADLPLTSIPASDAQQYVEWLSTTTGFAYRLPSDAEWTYAANAPGGGAERDFNCVVEINGQKIRGFGLSSVRSGRPNGWGLYNQIGNAQEWVKAGDGWSARGGAYSDPISQCGTALNRASAGAADVTTGFRVLRELR